MVDALATWPPRIDETIAELLPPNIDDSYLADFFGEPSYEYSSDSIEAVLTDPIWELLNRGGKRWRATLFLMTVEAFGEDPEEFLQYACIPEILHNGTIIVDDIQDEAQKRRGDPALHHNYGTDVALNAGNALYFIPLKIIDRNSAELSPDRRLRAYEMLTHELNRTHLGQGMDIHWHNQTEIGVSEDEYLEMCACKTGCLARVATRLAAIVSGQSVSAETSVANYAEDMSIAFQIGDDILDIENTRDHTGEFGKEFGNDIREGKKSLMVIHAAENAPSEAVARLEQILASPDNTDEEIFEAVDVLEQAGSIEYARTRARTFASSARAHLDDLDLETEMETQMRELTNFVIDRPA